LKINPSIEQQRVAVKLNEDYCSSCSICFSLCPFEAIKKDSETGKTLLEIDKCQVCGICYSTCPAQAISTIYYDIDSLTGYLERAKEKYDSDTLVIVCKGSAPDFGSIEKLFGISKFIPLSVPCVGRVPQEVFLKALVAGIGKIHILACDEDYCRFEMGSTVAGRKILALNPLLEQLGYGKEFISLKRNSLKVKVDGNKCISCGNCVFYCPYHAAKLEAPEAVGFDLDLCRGCGLCVALCPAMALELENWEGERISALIPRLSSEMTSPKILVFRCQWAVFPQFDEYIMPNVRTIELPCAARVDILHILEAFRNNIDGVLIAACPEDDCKQEKSSKEAEHMVDTLKKRLSQIGLEDGLHFCFTNPRCPESFTEELLQFKERVEAGLSKEGNK
jgi:coenzyme F420-reducing hydrogenase delta subunit/NAD-dependent dihydropyrimidine dehydrogenase PreA subunit